MVEEAILELITYFTKMDFSANCQLTSCTMNRGKYKPYGVQVYDFFYTPTLTADIVALPKLGNENLVSFIAAKEESCVLTKKKSYIFAYIIFIFIIWLKIFSIVLSKASKLKFFIRIWRKRQQVK